MRCLPLVKLLGGKGLFRGLDSSALEIKMVEKLCHPLVDLRSGMERYVPFLGPETKSSMMS